MGADELWWLANAALRECALFAAVGFVIGGIDDLAVDAIWIVRKLWRGGVVYRRHERVSAQSLPPPRAPGLIAIFVPAWDEAGVIGAMLRHAAAAFGGADWRVYVGCYRNDPGTFAEAMRVATFEPRIRPVVIERAGPTTKADCLNHLWRAMLRDEERDGVRVKAVALHDAEDIVHSCELRIFDRLIERFDLIQLPVLPLIDGGSRWIAGHYADEFAEAHAKAMVVREALGAGLPSAGVGCAFSREMLGRIASARGGAPFDADSLTEDYELGLRVAEAGGRGAFVRMPVGKGGPLVAVRAHFPATLHEAAAQKARWMTGIALAGWDRMGWRGGIAERWMRVRDRRAPLAALALVAAYAALILWAGLALAGWRAGRSPTPFPVALTMLMLVNAALLCWRLATRAAIVGATYGWREGLRAIPRAIVANVITIMAARRALASYLVMRSTGEARWDKTSHRFPDVAPAE